MKRVSFAIQAFLLAAAPICSAEIAGTASEPIRYLGNDAPDLSFHDGRLRPAVGVQNIQVMRANRSHPNADGTDGFGWTYNHAPMLAYWNGKFYLEYLGNPVGEHVPPGQTFLTESADGFNWSKPRAIFSPFKVPGQDVMTAAHQRMGFYTAPDGRLLVLSHYGIPPGLNDGKGIGRAVREIYRDGSLGPIYFIRYVRHAGWNETNTPYAFYKTAPDTGFITACDSLLANKLLTQQWWEEDRSEDGFFALAANDEGFNAQALSYFHRKDGAVVGLWKRRWAALSFNEGKSWTTPVQLPTVIHYNAKAWGQRTDDGRYAVVYNPAERYRWPLAVITSDDGVLFDNLLLLHGEIPYPRYSGINKNIGPQYMRGIAEGNGNPPGDELWLTYSVNKEDIWITRVPVPIRSRVTAPANDTFDDQPIGALVRDWNTYSPRWSPVSIAKTPDGAGHCLQLRDQDRYDYAKAERIFPEANDVTLRFRVRAERNRSENLEIEVMDARSARPVQLRLDPADRLLTRTAADESLELATLLPDRWHTIELRVMAMKQRFSVAVDGKQVLQNAGFVAPGSGALSRLGFRTGAFRDFDAKQTEALAKPDKIGDRLDGDEKTTRTTFHVDDVRVTRTTSK